jgi:hypothetical protein
MNCSVAVIVKIRLLNLLVNLLPFESRAELKMDPRLGAWNVNTVCLNKSVTIFLENATVHKEREHCVAHATRSFHGYDSSRGLLAFDALYERFGGPRCLHRQGEVKVEAVWSSEILVSYHRSIGYHNPGDLEFHDMIGGFRVFLLNSYIVFVRN